MPQSQTTPERTKSNPFHGKSFCEPNHYKSALDRSDAGYQSLELAVDMFKGLEKIIENYSAAIRDWSKLSQKQVAESREIGTNKNTWLGTIRALEKLTTRNDAIAAGIQQSVVEKITSYKNTNYGKSLLHVRKTKEFEKEFKKIQKPWKECLDKIADTKHAYHDVAQKLKQAKRSDNVTQSDVGSSEEDQQKSKATVERRTSETKKCKGKYQSALDDMESKKQKYQSDMFDILKRTDVCERERLEHFKSVFSSLKDAVLIEHDKYDTKVCEAFTQAIDGHKSEADIAYFNQNFGTGTETHWPVFEEPKE